MKDRRSHNIVVVAHCILNQNAKVDGIAEYPGAIQPIASLLVEQGVGIIQMPCPEFLYAGPRRWWCVREQYDNIGFKAHCTQIAKSIADEIEEYTRNGYGVSCIIGIDQSPSCGIRTTCTSRTYGGRPDRKGARAIRGRGVFADLLFRELKSRRLRIPMIGIPESGLNESSIGRFNGRIISLIKADRG